MDANPWVTEPEPVSEASFQHDGYGENWHSWNSMSPEREFCEWVKDEAGDLLSHSPDDIMVIETGVGQGYVTRRLLEVLRPRDKFMAFDTDASWLRLPAEAYSIGEWPYDCMPFFTEGTPSAFFMSQASLVILDSDLNYRYTEMRNWHDYASPGSRLIVHDTYQRLKPRNDITAMIDNWHWPTEWFSNPRGAALVVHP